ncbi:clp protease adapter protein ClpF, chloroplastic isoform X1 [Cannabis sativa]|uniref:clp protease adapter protein ClpF, chloroplastic isoform X1 n=1 Tax=Cannabis sativa TaxID=3483 RepID=UPI0029CA1924|nr:clp protease adapter protein ClpF, chloroplastic isoform X1 [Cannabis sativa]XP_030505594.2 clp protease adapter protein ClpF, chloroplastic isoform X1 [Cannabis sativa]
MVVLQNLSLSAVVTSHGNGNGVFGSWRRKKHFNLTTKTHIITHSLLLWKLQTTFLNPNPNPNLSSRKYNNNNRVEAGWLFKGVGGGDGLDATSERSENANEDILVFFFQLDLATRVQYALNVEQYDIAQQLRNKLTEVETEVIRQQEAKRGSSSKSEVQDKALSIIRLRADLQNAVESENYAVAAKLRDQISKLEAESLAAAAKSLAHDNAQYSFRLGQKVRHKVFGYKGVICGMDPVCCESSSWMETAQVEKLPRGSNQPFYQVLVDVHEDPNLLVAYVAEDNLLTPEPPNKGQFDHPYISFLFYGMDAAGDFIPIKQLREKYNRPRHEIPLEPDDEGNDDA